MRKITVSEDEFCLRRIQSLLQLRRELLGEQMWYPTVLSTFATSLADILLNWFLAAWEDQFQIRMLMKRKLQINDYDIQLQLSPAFLRAENLTPNNYLQMIFPDLPVALKSAMEYGLVDRDLDGDYVECCQVGRDGSFTMSVNKYNPNWCSLM